jgi:hypothetical protein
MTTFWPAVVWMSRNGRSAIMGRRKKSIFGKKSEKQFSFSFFSPAHVDSVTGFDEILPFGKKMKTLLVYLPIFNIFLEIKYSRRKFFPRSCLYVAQNLGIFGTFLSFSKTFLVSLHIGFFLLEQLLSQICCRFI